jgi:NitT/TauT family transport system substrate-binding protein
MKKAKVSIIASLFLLFFGLVSSCDMTNNNKAKTKVLLPDGITAVSLGGLFQQEDMEFSVVQGANLLTSALMQNEYDIIVAPITAGTKLYTMSKSNYRLSRIITTGANYLVSRSSDPISLESLNGKSIAAFGENNTPDLVLQEVLKKYNVSCSISYEASVNDVLSNDFMMNKADYYLLTEPVLSKIEKTLKIAIQKVNLENELQEQFDFFPQAGIFVKGNELTNAFLQKFDQNYLDLISNPEAYVASLLALDSAKYPTFSKLGQEVLISAIQQAGLIDKKAYENKTVMSKYYQQINEYNSSILGGKTPDELFYYQK